MLGGFLLLFVLILVHEISASRTQLHVHLDGAVTAQTLFEIARSRNLKLPVVGHPGSVRDVELLIALNVGFKAFDVRLHHLYEKTPLAQSFVP